MNRRLFTTLLLTGSHFLSAHAFAQIPGLEPEKNWDLGGYVKYMLTYTAPDETTNTIDHLLHQRFNFEYRFDKTLSLAIGLRNRALVGDSLDIPQYEQLIGLDAGYWDLSDNLAENDTVIVNSQFDRLFMDWNKGSWAARVGRFRVNWSMNTIWNPNDLFNAYSIYDFDYEERAGSDAFMLQRDLGFADGLDVVFSPSKDSELNDYMARYYGNSNGWDYQLLGGKSQLDNVFGGGFATDWQGAGVRGEVTWFKARKGSFRGVSLNNNTLVSLETDYSFAGERNWLARMAWLYIEHPIEVQNAQRYLNLPLNAKTLSFARHTGYLEVGFDITPLSRASVSTIYYSDDSYFIGFSNSYSLANNWQLLTVIQRFDGSKRSVFGETPATLLFANVKWSF